MNSNRRSIRLQGYDYSRAGAYAVTICTHNRDCMFGDIAGGKRRLNDGGRMVEWVWNELPDRFDHIDLDEFVVMPNHVHGILVIHRRGEPCVRPDSKGEHKIRPYNCPDSPNDRTSGEYKIRPYGSADNKSMSGDCRRSDGGRPHGTSPYTVGRIVQAFKSITTHKYIIGVKQNGWPPFSGKLWQRNYYERIIRNEEELNRIREYIINNPAQWELDRENPAISNAGMQA